MPCFNGNPKVPPEEQRRYRAQVLRSIKEGRKLAPQFRSTAPEFDLATLGLTANSVIADIGCGTGAFEFTMLERRHPFGKLYAVDIDDRALDFLDFALDASHLPGRQRITTVQSSWDDVRLPLRSVDVVLLHNTRFGMRQGDAPLQGAQLRQRDRAMTSLKRALRPGARIFVHEPTRTFGTDKPFNEKYISEPFLAHGFVRLSSRKIEVDQDQMVQVVFALKR